MSLYDYMESRKIAANDYPVDALIMAAYRKADSNNSLRLELAFPELCEEFKARYNSPGGVLPDD